MRRSAEHLTLLYVGTLPPHPGGSAVSCSQLLLGFARLDHRVCAVAPMAAQAIRAPDRFAAQHPEISVHRFPVPHFDATPYVPVSDEYRRGEGQEIRRIVSELIEEDRPDVIIIGRETFAWHVPDLARAHGVPSVLFVRGGTTIGILRGTLSEAQVRGLLNEFRKVDLIVAPARHLAEAFARFGFGNVRVIMNAVDLGAFRPKARNDALREALNINTDSVIAALVGNLNTRKRPLDVVLSAERVLRKRPTLTYVIVGDGGLRKDMEDLCRRLGVYDRFRFIGWVDYECVPDYLNLADLVILPSEAEGLARVYLETQACGRVLMATDIAPAREVVTDGETGLLFPVGDLDALTAKTLAAADDPGLRDRIGRAARRAVAAFSLDRAVAEYVAAFVEVIARRT